MIEVLTAIALWCGKDDTKKDFACRKWILKCVLKNSGDEIYLDNETAKASLQKKLSGCLAK